VVWRATNALRRADKIVILKDNVDEAVVSPDDLLDSSSEMNRLWRANVEEVKK
jgi:hypothetical protein